MAHASKLLFFLARFSMSGAVGRNMAGNTLKRGLKMNGAPHGVNNSLPGALKILGHAAAAALGAPAGRGGHIFAMFLSTIKNLTQFQHAGRSHVVFLVA
jgi:hypothetical protein